MRIYFTLCVLLAAAIGTTRVAIAQRQEQRVPAVVRVEPRPDKGFGYPYYLYTPPELHAVEGRRVQATILVVPNNTGKIDDDFAVHDQAARQQAEDMRGLASELRVAVLVPAFPRSKTDWRIYTQALDRDSLLTERTEYRRFDLQLIRMIDNARARLRGERVLANRHVLMLGFSAAGMFTNRFVFLHPDRIKAAAVGSPGGWAIAPVAMWEGRALRYPIGVADFNDVSGRPLDLKALRKVPLFIFQGGEDANDSVIFRDSYEKEDEDLIFALFGKTLQSRWESTKTIYGEKLPAAKLELYPNVGHSFSKEMWDDVKPFFLTHLRG